MNAIVYVALVFGVPETYAPRLLQKSGAQIELGSAKDKIVTALKRPPILLFTEPIVFAVSIYLAYTSH